MIQFTREAGINCILLSFLSFPLVFIQFNRCISIQFCSLCLVANSFAPFLSRSFTATHAHFFFSINFANGLITMQLRSRFICLMVYAAFRTGKLIRFPRFRVLIRCRELFLRSNERLTRERRGEKNTVATDNSSQRNISSGRVTTLGEQSKRGAKCVSRFSSRVLSLQPRTFFFSPLFLATVGWQRVSHECELSAAWQAGNAVN